MLVFSQYFLAACLRAGYFHDQGVDVFESSMRLNYMGTVNSIKAVYDRMLTRNTGHICIVSSAMGTMGEWTNGLTSPPTHHG